VLFIISIDGSLIQNIRWCVSSDTADKTKTLLERNSYFGLDVSQVTLLCQGKVPALLSNDAKLALSPGTKYVVDSKPHGLK